MHRLVTRACCVTYHGHTCIIVVIWLPVHITCIIVPCYCIHVTRLFPVIDTDIPDTGHVILLSPVTDMDIPVTGHASC